MASTARQVGRGTQSENCSCLSWKRKHQFLPQPKMQAAVQNVAVQRLMGACTHSGAAKEKGELENGEDGEDDRFSEIPPISTRRSNSMRSDVSEFRLRSSAVLKPTCMGQPGYFLCEAVPLMVI